jgi:hypothetical protein
LKDGTKGGSGEKALTCAAALEEANRSNEEVKVKVRWRKKKRVVADVSLKKTKLPEFVTR